MEKAQFLDAGDDLAQLRVCKLAGNGGSHHCVKLISFILLAFLNQLNHVQNKGFIHDGAKGALVNACAAGNALVVVYF